MLQDISGFSGRLDFDSSKPDGMMVKVLDSVRLSALGWSPKVDFADGLRRTYHWFLQQK